MKIRLQVEVIGDNSVAWCKHSGVIEGDDAANMIDGLTNPDPHAGAFLFPKPNGEIVFLPKALMDRAVITLEYV